MSHMIENSDTVYTPVFAGEKGEVDFSRTWHGLQTVLDKPISLDGSNIPFVMSPIGQCRMKPDLEGDIMVEGETATELVSELKNWKLIYSDDRKGKTGNIIPLHVPKSGYAIHQNARLFECMVKSAIAVLGEKGFQIVTVGTLGGQSQFFVSIAIKGQDIFNVGNLANGTKDNWSRFFNLNSSHNGLIASNRMLSMIRVVCMNTVQASIMDAENAGTIAGIKHTANSGDLITPEQFEKDLKAWLDRSKSFESMLETLKGEKMELEVFKHFSAGVFTNEGTDELSTNSFNRIDELSALFTNDKQGNVGLTRYDALNAFTDYFTNGNGAGSDKVSRAKRIANANFGRGNQWKLQALDMLLDDKQFKATVKRGKTLLKDKVAVMVTTN